MAGSHASTPTVINHPSILEIAPPMKLCQDCKHARQAPQLEEWNDGATCWRSPQTSYITGKLTSLRFCANERHNIAACGPDGRYFEERT